MTQQERLLKEIRQYKHDTENKSKTGAYMTYNEGLLYGVSILLEKVERIEVQLGQLAERERPEAPKRISNP